ncbi:MAG: hypothetical protein II865_05035 [Bacteroidales bacterium]|nr:hypothetical protein [Bacteroidales bacterium]
MKEIKAEGAGHTLRFLDAPTVRLRTRLPCHYQTQGGRAAAHLARAIPCEQGGVNSLNRQEIARSWAKSSQKSKWLTRGAFAYNFSHFLQDASFIAKIASFQLNNVIFIILIINELKVFFS